MLTLVVYDESLPVKKFVHSISKGQKFVLFPLTSRSIITSEVIKVLDSQHIDYEITNTGLLINQCAQKVRGPYLKFIAELPKKIKFKKGDLRSTFLIDQKTSQWWMTRLAEKNTFKSDTFNRLVQFESIVELIAGREIKSVICATWSEKLNECIKNYASGYGIKFQQIKSFSFQNWKRFLVESWFGAGFKHILILLKMFVSTWQKSLQVQKSLKDCCRNNKKKPSIMLILPFPNFDISAAQKGQFKDKSFLTLQDDLEGKGHQLVWMTFVADYNQMTFKEGMAYAREFINKGYNIHFIEQYNSLKNQFQALAILVKNAIKFNLNKKKIKNAHRWNNYNIYPLFRDDWIASFLGWGGFFGINSYLIYQKMLKEQDVDKCLFLCEMREWEKALICARNAIGSETMLYAYQLGTVSPFLLNYFNHNSEISDQSSFSLPQPDKIAVNGKMPYNAFTDTGWPKEKLQIVEAIRYNYLKDKIVRDKKNVVCIAFSIDAKESSGILNCALEAFDKCHDFEVWIKPHPNLELNKVFELSGISRSDCPFSIKNDSIYSLLSEAKVVIAGESGVNVEALAYGCHVINLNIPEWINMSPLNGIQSQNIHSISSPTNLNEKVRDILKQPLIKSDANEIKMIIASFFHLPDSKAQAKEFIGWINS